MHSYDLEGRGRVVVALFAASILFVWLLHTGMGTIGFEPPWWVSVPSYAAFYSVAALAVRPLRLGIRPVEKTRA